jgi:hypothetical protein
LLVSPHVGYLVLIQLFSGACWAGFDLCSCNFIYEAALPGKRLKYIAYHKALTTLFMALGALTGAYLLGFMRPILGHNILALFMLSGVLRLAVTMVLFPKLKEVRGTMRSALEQPVMVTAPDAAIVQRQALLYRPKEWANFGRRSLVLETVPIQDEPVDTTRGLFYRPQEWDRFGHPLASDASPIQAEPVATSRGLLYRPREWAKLSKSAASKAQSEQAQTRSEAVAANWGLFYRPGEWERFGRPQTSEVAQDQALSKMETPKRGLFHRAQVQSKLNKQSTTGNIMRQMQRGSLQPARVLAL